MTDAELIEALKEEARWLLGASLRHGSADAGMSGSLADAAADRIEAQAAEVARLREATKAALKAMRRARAVTVATQEYRALSAAIDAAVTALHQPQLSPSVPAMSGDQDKPAL